MKTFIYGGQLYIRCIPAKSLFHSSLIHEVVNRGDIFAVRVSDQVLTIVPGSSQVEHTSHDIILPFATNKTPATSSPSKAEARAKLKQLAEELRNKDSKQLSLLGNL